MTKGDTLVAEDAVTDVFRRIAARLPRDLPSGALDRAAPPPFGDHSLNSWAISEEFLAGTRVAAVLVGLVARSDGVTVLLTQRTAGLRDHAGQIAFPGGKVDQADASPAAAAIREAYEEIALSADTIEVLGHLDPYLTRTGFRIVPVVARITPPFVLAPNPAEVVDAFEVPFAFLMDVVNYRLEEREWLGKKRYFYSIPHGERRIWGVTAGILRVLHEKLYS